MATISLTLLNNSHAFLNEALSKAIEAERDPHQWQFAIFSLVQSIELTLKERLRREHPVLIFRDIDRKNQTVTLEQALTRLSEIARISITEGDTSAIRTAINWRNLVVHYEFEFSSEALKPVFAKLLGFLTSFHKAHLDSFLADHVSSENWNEAVAITAYGKELFTRAQTRFTDEQIEPGFIWTCPRCAAEAFVIQDDIDTCYVCNFQQAVLQCERCEEFFFDDQVQEVIVNEIHDHEIKERMCDDCHKKYIRKLEEDDYRSYEDW
jgi:hypothetical protein